MAVRLSQELIERSDAIRQLIELGLDRLGRQNTPAQETAPAAL
jgi:hypothetical protein